MSTLIASLACAVAVLVAGHKARAAISVASRLKSCSLLMHHVDKPRAFPIALLAITAVAAAVGCGSSGSKPAAQDAQAAPKERAATQAVTTRPSPRPQRFTSRRYGFRVTLTKEWSQKDALVDWNGKDLPGLQSGIFANFTNTDTGRTLAAAAAPPAKRMGLAAWRAAMVRAAPPVCSESSPAKPTTLDGEPGLAWTARCSDGYDVNKLAALHGTRGYILLLASPTANNNAADRQIFESIRRSFRFTR